MRCKATVPDRTLAIRARLSTQDPQCIRHAAAGHRLCLQHQVERWCRHVDCHTSSRRREQTGLWQTHHRIVSRILEIPARD